MQEVGTTRGVERRTVLVAARVERDREAEPVEHRRIRRPEREHPTVTPVRNMRRESSVPQQLGDLFERGPADESDGVVATEPQSPPVDARQGGADGHVDRGAAGGAPRTTAKGEPLDVGRGERAAPPVAGALAHEEAPAHVRIEGLHLHAEAIGSLLGIESGAGHELTIINVDQI